MSHISSIGAGMFSDLSVNMNTAAWTQSSLAALNEVGYKNLFKTEIESDGGVRAADTFISMKNARNFPSIGTPPNIVNVPVYGQKTSQQVQAQSNAPTLELTLNYVAADWAAGTNLGDAVGDGNTYVFRFALLNSEPDGLESDSVGGAAGIGTVENSLYFWYGKIEALQVIPSLSDANTATITLSIQSDFFGAFTV